VVRFLLDIICGLIHFLYALLHSFIFTTNVKTATEFIKMMKINISCAEIKIIRTSGQQSCPLISGLPVLSMSLTIFSASTAETTNIITVF